MAANVPKPLGDVNRVFVVGWCAEDGRQQEQSRSDDVPLHDQARSCTVGTTMRSMPVLYKAR